MSESCSAGTYRCQGAALERCDAGAWQSIEQCETDRLCADSAEVCRLEPQHCLEPDGMPLCLPPVCADGERRCDGQLQQQCAEGRTGWDVLQTCGEACGGQACDVEAGCVPSPCLEPGEEVCTVLSPGTFALVRCSADCSSFEPIDFEFCRH